MTGKDTIKGLQELAFKEFDTDDHDSECAGKAGELIELGFMGEEFACYGTCYLQDHRIKYYVCQDEQMMMRFQKWCIEQALPLTEIRYDVKRFQVPTGKNDFFRQLVFQEFAEELKQAYSYTVLSMLYEWQNNLPRTDVAWATISKMMIELRNSLQPSLIQTVQGLAEDAYLRRTLTKEHYDQVMTWAKKEMRNALQQVTSMKRHQRTYYGFCFKSEAKVQYYSNASLFATRQRKWQKIAEGAVVSPILSETYYENAQQALLQDKQVFQQLLQKYYDDEMMNALKILWCTKQFAQDLEGGLSGADGNELTPEERKTVAYYRNLWCI